MKNILLLVAIFHAALLQALPAHMTKTTHKKVARSHAAQCFLACDVAVFDIKAGVFTLDKNKNLELLADYHIKTAKVEDPYLLVKALCDDIYTDTGCRVTDACLAIPGMMRDGLFLHPHFPWNTSSDVSRHADTAQRGLSHVEMLRVTGLSNVYFINDFQAAALGAVTLNASQLKGAIVNIAKPQPKAPKLVIGAGNGLGASLLIWDEALADYVPMQLNYSFTEFGAQSTSELEFLNYMKKETGNIAWGKVLGSTGGIILMYNFFQEKEQLSGKYAGEEKAQYAKDDYLQVFKDGFAGYGAAARAKVKSQCAADAVDLYITFYGRWIRNVMYTQAPMGGVYVINSVLQNNEFIFSSENFVNKIENLDGIVPDAGSKKYLENYLHSVPLTFMYNKDVALYGAAKLCVKPHLIRN